MEVIWYVDSWAVADGAAFASQREEDTSRGLAATPPSAEATVFIGMPDLVPVPVGRPAIAWSATRHGFQRGLWDEDGREVGFSGLDQIVELVRQGYLGGGLGPGGAGAPPLPPDRGDDGPESPGGRWYAEGAFAVRGDRPPANAADWPVASLAYLVDAVIEPERTPEWSQLSRPLDGSVRLYAEAVTLNWGARPADPHSADARMLGAWALACTDIGIWSHPYDAMAFMAHHLRHPARMWPPEYWWWWGFPRRRSAVLWHAPCPRLPHWPARAARLSDLLALPMCVPGHLRDARFPDLAPVVLAAAVVAAPQAYGPWSTERLGGSMAAGLRWLARQLPRVELPAAARRALDAYVTERVGTAATA